MTKIASTLLVDDDDTANFLNQMLFKKTGISEKLLVARNGREALALLHQNCQDSDFPMLILLDMKMPIMDGLEFLEAFEKMELSQKESIVIVMLTTSNNPNDLEKVKRVNVAGLVNKPLTKKALQEIADQYF